MRHHFHRCASLRVVSIPASDLHGARRGGGIVVEELCEAKGLTPCVGLADCDLLTPGEKQELLVERATRIRSEEGRPTELSGVSRQRGAEIRRLREALLRERETIVEENRRREAELGGAESLELPAERGAEAELRSEGLSLRLDPAWEELRIDRLDAIDRALDAMRERAYGACALCGGEIALDRLRRHPETRVCEPCAREAPAPAPRPAARR